MKKAAQDLTTKKVTRRHFISGSLAAGAALTLPAAKGYCARKTVEKKEGTIRKAIVIGMDGMDPKLIKTLMEQGHLPTFKKLAQRGTFSLLETTSPPQSPVAWASFITGSDPGVHGIYDFVHRMPQTFTPYLSTSQTLEAAKTFRLGNWTIPLSSAEVTLMRKGKPVWDILSEYGIPSTIFQIPANYPTTTEGDLVTAISGMGTPDVLGTYGTFTVFTDAPVPPQAKNREGRWVPITFENHKSITHLDGPINSLRVERKPAALELIITRDPENNIVRLQIQDHEILLEQGQWSAWLPLSFEMVPVLSHTKGMIRFLVKSVHNGFSLYCSPINIDPLTPALPISTPHEYSSDIAEQTGRFYTQGFPADTKALSAGAFSTEEFYHQSQIVIEESLINFEKTLNNFQDGLYFFYFSSIDQSSHMMWRLLNPNHPLYEADLAPEIKQGVISYYKQMDWVLSKALEKENEETLVMALSDHGFSDFTREFNVSTWLVQEGFTRLDDEQNLGCGTFYEHVDWLETTAYSLGINSIYINRRGRDKFGIVEEDEVDALKQDIIQRLEKVIDPRTGKRIVIKAYDCAKTYTNPDENIAPDIVIGYAAGYRISDEAVLGVFPTQLVADRKDLWSADHCVDPSVVPGMVITNRHLHSPGGKIPGIWDLAPSLLAAFGIATPEHMTGKNVFKV